MRFDKQGPAVGVDERVALAAVDLFSRIIAARPAGFGGLDALAVDNGRCRRGLPADALAVGHDQGVVDLLKHAAVAKGREPAIDRLPGRKIRAAAAARRCRRAEHKRWR